MTRQKKMQSRRKKTIRRRNHAFIVKKPPEEHTPGVLLRGFYPQCCFFDHRGLRGPCQQGLQGYVCALCFGKRQRRPAWADSRSTAGALEPSLSRNASDGLEHRPPPGPSVREAHAPRGGGGGWMWRSPALPLRPGHRGIPGTAPNSRICQCPKELKWKASALSVKRWNSRKAKKDWGEGGCKWTAEGWAEWLLWEGAAKGGGGVQAHGDLPGRGQQPQGARQQVVHGGHGVRQRHSRRLESWRRRRGAGAGAG